MFNAKGEKAADQAAGKKGRTGQPFRFASFEIPDFSRCFFQSLLTVTVALYPLDGSDAENLLKNADVAMYHKV